MRMLSLPVHVVKFSIRSKRSQFLAVTIASAMAMLLAVSVFIAKRSSAHSTTAKKEPIGCCSDQPAVPRRMIGTYYTAEDGFQSTLILNNKGPNQIMVTPILHSQDGQTFTASPVAVSGQSSSEIDLNLLAQAAGPQFLSGCRFDHNLILGRRRINTLRALFDHNLVAHSTITWSKG